MQCHQCGTSNREGELVCGNCGALLVAQPATRRLKVTTGLLNLSHTKHQTSSLQSVTFEIEGIQYEFPIKSGEEVLIGRGTGRPSATEAASLDLLTIGGHQKGVSRRHAMIHAQGSVVYLVDLGSTNGTFLNGRRLEPHQRRQVFDGDVIRFGKLESRISLA